MNKVDFYRNIDSSYNKIKNQITKQLVKDILNKSIDFDELLTDAIILLYEDRKLIKELLKNKEIINLENIINYLNKNDIFKLIDILYSYVDNNILIKNNDKFLNIFYFTNGIYPIIDDKKLFYEQFIMIIKVYISSKYKILPFTEVNDKKNNMYNIKNCLIYENDNDIKLYKDKLLLDYTIAINDKFNNLISIIINTKKEITYDNYLMFKKYVDK